MAMAFQFPMVITSRLLPGVQVADAVISVETIGFDPGERRAQVKYVIDYPATTRSGEFTADDLGIAAGELRPDQNDDDAAAITVMALHSLLGYLTAAAEQYASWQEPEDGWLFDREVGEWAYVNSDAIEAVHLLMHLAAEAAGEPQ